MSDDKLMDAFRRGQEAHDRNAPFTANPFSDKGKRWDFWGFGWESAQADARKKGKAICKSCGFSIHPSCNFCSECLCEEDGV